LFGSRLHLIDLLIQRLFWEKRGHRTEIGNRSQGNVWLVDISAGKMNLYYKTIVYRSECDKGQWTVFPSILFIH
jgi:hypothetical protein